MSKQRFISLVALLVMLSGFAVGGIQAQNDCPADHFIDVQPAPENSAYPAPELTVTCTDDTVIIESNAIPDFEFLRTTPGELVANDFMYEIPLNPVFADEPTDIPIVFTVALAVNGIPIFGPNEAPQDDYGDPVLDELLDYCNGHVGGSTYHFHAAPKCIFEEYDGNVGLVVAYALDGFPILAPFACENDDCSVTYELSSSWQRTSDVRNAWEANEYIEGSGDLDQCNGMVLEDGSYAYFATETFPYFLSCYMGEVDEAYLTVGPFGDQGGDQQGQPPQGGQDGQQSPPDGQRPPGGGGDGQQPPPDGQRPPGGGGDGQGPPPPPGG